MRESSNKSGKMKKMASPQTGMAFTPEERLARRNLIVRDAVSLVTLFLITAIIFVLTLLLFRSFTSHRQELGARWKARGEAALHGGHPGVAIEDLRSALAYVPDRATEIELATALADAGKLQEASVYFHYQAALDGAWQGNGYDRRREVRLEMARYLISGREDSKARAQLLIAAGNAPDDPAIKLAIAGLLEQANATQDALGIYRSLAARREPPLAALEGAGRTAFGLGMYRLAEDYLSRALASPLAINLSDDEKTADRNMLDTSLHVLLLYPSFDLTPRNRAQRVLAIRNVARRSLSACMGANPTAPPKLPALVSRWGQLPSQITVSQFEQQPNMEQTILQLAYDTETAAAPVCGPPTGNDALLLRIANNPSAVDQQ
jgi:tetratricopeptide (TPR) repeat protein